MPSSCVNPSKTARIRVRPSKKCKSTDVQRKKVAGKRKIKKKASPVRLILILILIAAAAGSTMYGLMFLQGGL